jgi:putative flavoprotein involved in K+ transport
VGQLPADRRREIQGTEDCPLPGARVTPRFACYDERPIPDLTARGLPRPSAPFSQFQRNATAPLIDVGFVDAVRDGTVEVVPAVTALDGGPAVLADGSRVYPDAIVGGHGLPSRARAARRPCHYGWRTPHPEPAALPSFLGIGIPLSGLLHQVGKDARQTAANVARELRHQVK